jgi:ribonuclease P protein component
MRRSADFNAAVKHGVRAVQPDIVVHARHGSNASGDEASEPRVGLIVAKSVGSAVQRHRVARRLRHVLRGMLRDMDAAEHLVVRALPSSRQASSATLTRQLQTGLQRAHDLMRLRR